MEGWYCARQASANASGSRVSPISLAKDATADAMQDAFDSAGIPWDECCHEDRGDGVFVLVPAEIPKALLAESLPPALVTALRDHNDGHPGPEQIRLRMALHAGEVSLRLEEGGA